MKRTLTGTLQRHAFLTLALAMAAIGWLWIRNRIQAFEAEAERMRTEYMLTHRALLRGEVDRALSLVNYERANLERRIRANLQTQVEGAIGMANTLHRLFSHVLDEDALQTLLREALRADAGEQGDGLILVAAMDGTCVLSESAPEYEGKSAFSIPNLLERTLAEKIIHIARSAGEGFVFLPSPDAAERQGGAEAANYSSPGFADTHLVACVKRFAPLEWAICAMQFPEKEEARLQHELLERIGAMRFGMDGYLFVVDFDGVTLMNSVQPHLIGQNLWEMEDPNGVKVIQEERRAAEQPDGGFIYYDWEQPKTGNKAPKMSFVRGVPEWRWMIGAGQYIGEIDGIIQRKEALLRLELQKGVERILLILALLAVLLWLASAHMRRRLGATMATFQAFFRQAIAKKKKIDCDSLPYREFEELGDSANQMLDEYIAAETALRQSEERFRHLVEQMPLPIAIVADNGSIEYINRRFEEAIGYTMAEMPSFERWWLLSYPDAGSRAQAIERWEARTRQAAASDGEILPDEYEIRTRNGELRRMEIFGSIIARRTIVIFNDITQQKRTEEELRQFAETRASLLREVNHRVKNNLSAIISMLNGERARIRDEGLDAAREALGSLEQRVRGLATVHSMLSASEWRPLPLRDLCERIAQSVFQAAAPAKRIDLRVQGGEDVIGSELAHHLALVVNELAVNTAKHAMHGRSQGCVEIGVAKEGAEFRIHYKDDGPGFPGAFLSGDFRAANVGFSLIQGIVRETLSGELRLSNEGGAAAIISFSEDSDPQVSG
ncbi:MAG: Methyl-accepting chemotaxis protein 4 [candidate division BRC1 bacterium ADurb.BinA364]|nr:MAG: Methyl-accepting chemotaxis protein 4 [candidate division BRC1 bacterium ADurb.BinA364]